MFWIEVLKYYMDKTGKTVVPGEYLVSGYHENSYEIMTKDSYSYILVPKSICKKLDNKGFSRK